MVTLEIVYCDQDKVLVQKYLDVAIGTTVREALMQSKLYDAYPECKTFDIGIFSQAVSFEQQVQKGDRIEVYRPLQLDPMEKRRQRAKKD